MARSVTCATLKRQIRELADQKTDAPSESPVNETQLLGMLNASIGVWHAKLVQADPERFETEVEFEADGSASYALPADHYKTLSVDREFGSNVWWPLDRIMFQERTKHETEGEAVGYRLRAASLVLIPAPSSGTYRHTYVTAAPVFTDDDDTLDGCDGWEMWIVYDVVTNLLLQEGSNEEAAGFAAKRASIEVEIEAAAADRDAATPRRIVATRPRFFRLDPW